jgi:hypothetical protein
MDYASFLHQQIVTIVGQYFNNSGNSAWIGVPDLNWLTRDGANMQTLPGFALNEAAVRRSKDGSVELWCKPVDKTALKKAGKRDDTYSRAWAEYTSMYAKTTPVSQLNGHDLQVDHLFPETAGARIGLTYVRLLPVDERPNRTVGSTIERAAAGPKPGTFERPRHATAFTMAKVSGFQPSLRRAFDSHAIAQALVEHLIALGYPVPAGALADVEIDVISQQIDWYRGDL